MTAIRALHSPALVGVLMSLATLPWLVAAIPAGVVVDRLPAHRVIQIANLGRAGVMLATGALCAGGRVTAVVLAVAVFVCGVLQTFVDGAAEALVPEVVTNDRLSDANGALAVSTRVFFQFLGPPIAGLAFTLWSPAAALLAGTLCAASTACIGVVRSPWPSGRVARRKLELTRGARIVLRSRVLISAIVVSAITTIANGLFTTTFAVHANAATGLGLSATTYGVLTGPDRHRCDERVVRPHPGGRARASCSRNVASSDRPIVIGRARCVTRTSRASAFNTGSADDVRRRAPGWARAPAAVR